MYYIFNVKFIFETKENRDGFLKEALENNIDTISESEKGCKQYKYLLPTRCETELDLIEKWETLEDQKVHMTQPHLPVAQALEKKYNAKLEFGIEKVTE